MHGHRFTRGQAIIILAALVLTGPVLLGFGVAAARAALPSCPTQRSLERLGAWASEVNGAPNVSSGTFPVAQGLTVPDERCSYPGPWGLSIVYWQLTAAEVGNAKKHFAYECKLKSCNAFLSIGTNTSVVVKPNGKTSTKTSKTFNEVVILGKVNGEATVDNPPTSQRGCAQLGSMLFSFVAGRKFIGNTVQTFPCP
jgi:hypothetical protein